MARSAKTVRSSIRVKPESAPVIRVREEEEEEEEGMGEE
jgi:hypothetical protein